MKTSSLASSLLLAAGVVVASPAVASAGGPSPEAFEDNPTFLCGPLEGGVPPNHCINSKGKGSTGVILVFAPDPRGPQESYSTNPQADTRPCPHDDDADPDGTWWAPVEGFYVCHHRP